MSKGKKTKGMNPDQCLGPDIMNLTNADSRIKEGMAKGKSMLSAMGKDKVKP